MNKARFITFEGGEGCGKSVQTQMLSEYLRQKGINVLTTKEPGGTPIGQKLRSILVEGDKEKLDCVAEMLLYYADRRIHLQSKILPAMAEGKWVISDRYADSTMAYQYYGYECRIEKSLLDKMYRIAAGDFVPEHIGTAFLRCLEIFPYEELKEKTSVEICEKLEIIREEIEPEALEAEVERVMEPETKKTPILTRLLASPKRMIKVAFIYEGSTNSSEWNYAHELGRQQLEDAFSGRVITSVYETIQPQTPRSEVLEAAIEDGNAVIFTTTATLMQASVQIALKHPEIYIFNCSLNFPYKSVRTYLTRNYEMKFLLGLIAGAAADRESMIGYEEDYPMYGTIANINAFSIGVQMMQPGARVKLIWTGVKNSKSEEEKKKLRIISAKEMISKKGTESPYGLYFQENGEITRIATSIINWGKFYERIMQYILDGFWKPMAYGDKKTLNYWWGLSAGVVELICSDRVPGGVKRMAESFAQFIAEGSFHPFEGKMRDQNGKIHGIDGETLEVEELVTMDWLYENVIGRIPEQSELEEGARELLKLQGL